MMEHVTDREILQSLTNDPIRSAARANKIWLPYGRRPPDRAGQIALKETQTDIEDAVEQAGGARGSMGRAA